MIRAALVMALLSVGGAGPGGPGRQRRLRGGYEAAMVELRARAKVK